MIDVDAFVSEYTNNKTHTLKTISAAYDIKPADAAALLRLHGITIRRGAPNGISEEARAKARETQHTKALRRTLMKLVAKYGGVAVLDAVPEAINSVQQEQLIKWEAEANHADA